MLIVYTIFSLIGYCAYLMEGATSYMYDSYLELMVMILGSRIEPWSSAKLLIYVRVEDTKIYACEPAQKHKH